MSQDTDQIDMVMDKVRREELIQELWERSNHGTQRVDIESAYNAGLTDAIKIIKAMRKSVGPNDEAIVVDRIIDRIEKQLITAFGKPYLAD